MPTVQRSQARFRKQRILAISLIAAAVCAVAFVTFLGKDCQTLDQIAETENSVNTTVKPAATQAPSSSDDRQETNGIPNPHTETSASGVGSASGAPAGIPSLRQASLLTFGYAENNALEHLCPKERGMKAIVPGEKPSQEELSPKRLAYKKAAERQFNANPTYQHGMLLYMTCVVQHDKACVERVLTVMCEGTTPPGYPIPQ